MKKQEDLKVVQETQAARKEQSDLERQIERIQRTINTKSHQMEKIRGKVAKNNRDSDAQRELNKIEEELESEKKKLQECEKRSKELTGFIRELELKIENNKIDTVNAKIQKLKKRRDEILHNLIPKQEIQLNLLKEESKQLDDQMKNLTAELNKSRM